MTTITIPKKVTRGEELIIIPRREYEEIFSWWDVIKSFKTFIPTSAQKRDLKKARGDYKKGKYFTIDEFKRKLEIKD